MPEIKVTLFL